MAVSASEDIPGDRTNLATWETARAGTEDFNLAVNYTTDAADTNSGTTTLAKSVVAGRTITITADDGIRFDDYSSWPNFRGCKGHGARFGAYTLDITTPRTTVEHLHFDEGQIYIHASADESTARFCLFVDHLYADNGGLYLASTAAVTFTAYGNYFIGNSGDAGISVAGSTNFLLEIYNNTFIGLGAGIRTTNATWIARAGSFVQNNAFAQCVLDIGVTSTPYSGGDADVNNNWTTLANEAASGLPASINTFGVDASQVLASPWVPEDGHLLEAIRWPPNCIDGEEFDNGGNDLGWWTLTGMSWGTDCDMVSTPAPLGDRTYCWKWFGNGSSDYMSRSLARAISNETVWLYYEMYVSADWEAGGRTFYVGLDGSGDNSKITVDWDDDDGIILGWRIDGAGNYENITIPNCRGKIVQIKVRFTLTSTTSSELQWKLSTDSTWTDEGLHSLAGGDESASSYPTIRMGNKGNSAPTAGYLCIGKWCISPADPTISETVDPRADNYGSPNEYQGADLGYDTDAEGDTSTSDWIGADIPDWEAAGGTTIPVLMASYRQRWR